MIESYLYLQASVYREEESFVNELGENVKTGGIKPVGPDRCFRL